ncbi:hypothetical protein [Phenylobacterium sp.]|uniref:hypothetical protein n=1 Tax=Phenylobacterium sp. TaxID=1871053 RepID=UPI0030F48D02
METPAEATRPCDLFRLPPNPTQADLDGGYGTRGAQILVCDGKRDLAVQAQELEHQLIDQWIALRAERNRPWWKVWQ